MKTLIIMAVLAMAAVASADQNVSGYYRSNGTYVAPYTRSTPDNSYNNNYSTSPNVNPYNSSQGSNTPTYNDRTPSYNQRQYGNSGTYNSPSTNTYQNPYNQKRY